MQGDAAMKSEHLRKNPDHTPASGTRELKGHIVVVQEERFRVVDELGRSFLFDLSHSSSIGNEDLLNLNAAKADLIIQYEGEPELETGVAHSIRLA